MRLLRYALAMSVILSAGIVSAQEATRGKAGNWAIFGANAQHTWNVDRGPQFPLSLAWRFYTRPTRYRRTTPIVVEKDVFHISGNELYALDAETGSPRWRVEMKDENKQPVAIRAPAAYVNGKLWVGTVDGVIRALDATDGSALWKENFETQIFSPFATDGDLVFFAVEGRRVLAVDTRDYKVAWSFRAAGEVFAAPTLQGRFLFVGDVDNGLYCIEKSSGKEFWRYQFSGMGGIFNTPVVGSRLIYVAIKRTLYAVTRRGTREWFVSFPRDITSDPSLAGGLIYVPCDDRRVYALDARSSRVRWQAECPSAPTTPLVVAGNVGVVGCRNGWTVALDARTGKVLWKHSVKTPDVPGSEAYAFEALSGPVVTGDAVYMTFEDGTLCRFTSDAPDWTSPSITKLTPDQMTPISAWPPIVLGANIYDEGSGVDLDSVKIRLDGKEIEWEYRSDNSDFYFVIEPEAKPKPLQEGWHVVEVEAADYRGNRTIKTWRFVADPTKPAVKLTRARAVTTPGAGPASPGAAQQPEEYF
jgi:outer membrane protein assembly factor BamB